MSLPNDPFILLSVINTGCGIFIPVWKNAARRKVLTPPLSAKNWRVSATSILLTKTNLSINNQKGFACFHSRQSLFYRMFYAANIFMPVRHALFPTGG